MTDKELRTKLYEKMAAEQKRYRFWLHGEAKDVILSHAAEYTVRENIVMAMSALELPEAQVRALLKSKTPLADIYREWDSTETHHMDEVRAAIEARANAVIQAEKDQREER